MRRRIALIVALAALLVVALGAVVWAQTRPGCYSNADAKQFGFSVCINNESR